MRALLDLAVEGDHLSGLEAVLEVGAAEPDAFQGVAALARSHLHDGHAPGTQQHGSANLGDYAGHFSGRQLGDAARINPILIAKWQIIKEILDDGDSLGGQRLGQARAYALDELNRRAEFHHRLDGTEPGPSYESYLEEK